MSVGEPSRRLNWCWSPTCVPLNLPPLYRFSSPSVARQATANSLLAHIEEEIKVNLVENRGKSCRHKRNVQWELQLHLFAFCCWWHLWGMEISQAFTFISGSLIMPWQLKCPSSCQMNPKNWNVLKWSGNAWSPASSPKRHTNSVQGEFHHHNSNRDMWHYV